MKKSHEFNSITIILTIFLILCCIHIYSYTATAEQPLDIYQIPLQNKWNLVTIPVNETITQDRLTILNNTLEYNWTEAINNGIILGFIYKWNEDLQIYESSDGNIFSPGDAYWLWSYYPCTINFKSNISGDGYIKGIKNRWNLVGLPYNATLSVEDLLIEYDEYLYSWDNATSSNNIENQPLLLHYIYSWDNIFQMYATSTELNKSNGYWMYAFYNLTLRQQVTKPVIIDNSEKYAGTGNIFICDISVSDSDGIDGVWIEYWFDNGSRTIDPMNSTGYENNFQKEFQISSASLSNLHYIIYARNIKTIWNNTEEQIVNIIDDDPPEITEIFAIPSNASQGTFINISCNVTDNIAVSTVNVIIMYPDNYTVNISMQDGYYFVSQYVLPGKYYYKIWTNDTSNNTNISIIKSFTITTISYNINASAGNGGTIDPIGTISILYSYYKNFTITPYTGYHIADVLVDSESVGAISWYNFTEVKKDHTIHASFAIDVFKITASASAGGSIDPVGDVFVNYSEWMNFTIIPNVGYSISDVEIDGSSVGVVHWYNFTNVTANHTITATFSKNEYSLLILTNGTGSGIIEKDNPGPYFYNDVVELTAIPDNMSMFTGWYGDLSGLDSHSYLIITGNMTVTAEFMTLYSVVLLDDGFEGGIWDGYWNDIPHEWLRSVTQFHTGNHAAFAQSTSTRDDDGPFICNELNASDAVVLEIDFWFRHMRTFPENFTVSYFNGTHYIEIAQLGGIGVDGDWIHFSDIITDAQFFVEDFKIMLNASLLVNSGPIPGGQYVYIDDVMIIKKGLDLELSPVIENPVPLNNSMFVSLDTNCLSVDISDPNLDLLFYSIETNPDIGSQQNLSGFGEAGGIKTCIISGLTYNTTYTWFVNVTDGKEWVRRVFYFSTVPYEIQLLNNPTFEEIENSTELRSFNPDVPDWYESRNDLPGGPDLLSLNEDIVGGNSRKKASFFGFGQSKTAYMSQEFVFPQTGGFNMSFDVYIENIQDYQNYDRTAFIFIGDDSDGQNGPCSTSSERFVFLVFYDTGASAERSLQLRARTNTSQWWNTTEQWKLVKDNLSYNRWYTISLNVNLIENCYDVYLDNVLIGDCISGYPGYNSYPNSVVTHITFSTGGTARGNFFIDNVYSPTYERYHLFTDTQGGGDIIVTPGESSYAYNQSVTVDAIPYSGWNFSHWSGDFSGSENPKEININATTNITAVFITGNVIPLIETNIVNILSTSINVEAVLVDDGGEACSVWFEYDQVTEIGECVGAIATGTVCKDNLSINWKNRHTYGTDYIIPRYFQGTNYSYYGVGILGEDNNDMNRMGQNELGLAIANADVFGSHRIPVDKISHISDKSSPDEDYDKHHVLGNYSTVEEAAVWLATHSKFHGNYWITSAEPGVGAVVGIDKDGNSNISWVNNSYAAIANKFFCTGQWDSDNNDKRAYEIMTDISVNSTSSDDDHLLNWKDIVQRVAKDTSNKEDGIGTFRAGGVGGEISNDGSTSAMVSVSGIKNDVLVSISWLSFGKMTKLSIFLPIHPSSFPIHGMPNEFGNDSGTNPGVAPHVEIKQQYANEGLQSYYYHCDRVREIERISSFNENITFHAFQQVLDSINDSTTQSELNDLLFNVINTTLPIALQGYINNISSTAQSTSKTYPHTTDDIISYCLTNLTPATIYSIQSHANNSVYTGHGNVLLVLTKPEHPSLISVSTFNDTSISLSWIVGTGANTTIIERNIISSWNRGNGLEVFNGTGTFFKDSSCAPGTTYYYQFWSFASKNGLYGYSFDSAYGTNTTSGSSSDLMLFMPFTNDTIPIPDKSGHGNTGTPVGATWNNLYSGYYTFDGVDDYIIIDDSLSLDGGGDWTEMSIEFWIKSDDETQIAKTILDKRDDTSSYQIGISSSAAGKVFSAFWTSNSGYKDTSSTNCPVLETGVWYHVVTTYKDGEGIKIYFNGGLNDTNTAASGTISSSTGVPLNIGRRGADNTRHFQGGLDDIRIYSRALNHSEIQQRYLNSKHQYMNYIITALAGENGFIVPDGVLSVAYGDFKNFSIIPDTGFHILDVIVDGSSIGVVEYYNFSFIEKNYSIESVFEQDIILGSLEITISFDSASIDTYEINEDSVNFTVKPETMVNSGDEYCYWVNFKVQNVSGKTIVFNITNAEEIPFLTTSHEAQLVYSYDGDSWYRFMDYSYLDGVYTFSETFTAGNIVQIATFLPYSYGEMNEYIDSISSNEWVTNSVLGSSLQGRDIHLVNITNSSISINEKKVIYIIARQHAHETTCSHMIEGLIDYLISDDETAKEIRDTFVWYIVPMVNPDGVYLGKSRATSIDRDPNRDWLNNNSVEINIVRNHLDTVVANMGVDLFIDWHSQMNDIRWYNFVYSPPGNTFFDILSKWTDFDHQESPSAGSTSARGYATSLDLFTFVFEPTPHLQNWTIASLQQQGVNTAYAIHEYFFGTSNTPPSIQNENPLNHTTDISLSIIELTISIADEDGDLLNYSIETSPVIGSQNNLSGPGETGGIKTCSLSDLAYDTTYTWFVNVTDGKVWTNRSFWFTTEPSSISLIVDSEFEDSIDSDDLRANSTSQDWYESRTDNPLLLTLDTLNIGGNIGKKAALNGSGTGLTAYLSQELRPISTELFNVSLNIYIDTIDDYSDYDRTGFIFLGNDDGGTNGPCSTGFERFVYLTFYDATPGDFGDDIILKAREWTSNQSWSTTSQWTTVATNLSYKTWYNLSLQINIINGTYNVYLNNILKAENIRKFVDYTSDTINHLSISVGGTARGGFYVDDVYSFVQR